jgi:hypothetical protein
LTCVFRISRSVDRNRTYVIRSSSLIYDGCVHSALRPKRIHHFQPPLQVEKINRNASVAQGARRGSSPDRAVSWSAPHEQRGAPAPLRFSLCGAEARRSSLLQNPPWLAVMVWRALRARGRSRAPALGQLYEKPGYNPIIATASTDLDGVRTGQ